ncbi:Protein yippee-like protein [Cucurbita argyrosperma subsp. argyrosperma]|nr:Protein yippee-like protein [Cucurbita argyrosperma subsp. argyrosperma]
MGRIFVVEREGSSYRCKFCNTQLALADDLASRAFHCRRGKAYLFNNAINFFLGALEDRIMLSGSHTVADIFCCKCGQIVGWKYVSSLYYPPHTGKEMHLVINMPNFPFFIYIPHNFVQEAAHEKSQKYKEGKYVLERGRIVDDIEFSTGFYVDSRSSISDSEDN